MDARGLRRWGTHTTPLADSRHCSDTHHSLHWRRSVQRELICIREDSPPVDELVSHITVITTTAIQITVIDITLSGYLSGSERRVL
jgi:hypothetical protein